MPSTGWTNSEEIEQSWARHNQTLVSIRKMGLESCKDTLEDHFNYANYKEYMDLGTYINSPPLAVAN